MSRFVHGLIAGHGGLHPQTGQYVTAPKKMCLFGDGRVVYEGVENRNIVNAILAHNVLGGNQLANVEDLLHGAWEDTPRSERIEIVNERFDELKAQGKELLLWEIHNNAYQPNKAEGREIFTTRGNNFSDTMATIWWNVAKEVIPDQKLREDWSDGDPDKEKDYDIIKGVKCFAVLPECFFFDQRDEVEKYCNPDGYSLWATVFLKTFQHIDRIYG